MSDYANSGHATFLSEGLSWQETHREYTEKECEATMGHYTMASVPRHIRIDHPMREVFLSQGKKCFTAKVIYEYNGNEYAGASELAEALGIIGSHIHNIIQDGVYKGIPVSKKVKRPKTVRVKWNGQEYESTRDFADVHQISLDSAKAMLSRGLLLRGLPVERIPNE